MKDDSYSKAVKPFNFTHDPFPITPPETVDYWADNTLLLKELIKLEVQSLGFSSTSLYIYWGPKGTGKTFAARYFSNETIINKLLKYVKSNQNKKVKIIKVDASLPSRAGGFTPSIHHQLILGLIQEIINDDRLRKEMFSISDTIEYYEIQKAFKDMCKCITTRPLMQNDASKNFVRIQESQGFKYITAKTQGQKKPDTSELTNVIKILIEIILKKYYKLKIIIDEMENLSEAKLLDRLFFSDYLRKLHDSVDQYLDIILIYTLDAFSDVEYSLSDTLRSRINKKIDFSYVTNRKDLREYIIDCIRLRGKRKIEEIMEPKVLDNIIDYLSDRLGKITFREINMDMRSIISSAYYINKNFNKITVDIFSQFDKEFLNDQIVEEFKDGLQ